MLIVTTATLGLLLIGMLAISMTPERAASPETAASTISGLRTVPATAAALAQPPLVTPLGEAGWGVTTMSAVAGRSGRRVEARLPSGQIVDVEIVATDRSAGLTVVSLPAVEGYELAATEPGPSDTVLVHTDPPRVVTMLELAALDVDEATPVLDEAGDLIGLCTYEDDRVALATVVTMPDDRATTTVATTRPPATSPPTTTTPASSAPPATTTTTTTVPGTTTSIAPATTGGRPPGQITGGGGATTAPG